MSNYEKNIRNKFYIYMLFFMFLILGGCVSIHEKTYTYKEPLSSEGKQCVYQCIVKKNNCQKKYLAKDRRCRLLERKKAFYHYQNYRTQCTLQGITPTKSLNYFDKSYSNCNEHYDCSAYFNTCYQTCGGIVEEHTINF